MHYPCVNVKEDIYLAGNVSKDFHIHSFTCCIYEYLEHLQQYSVYDPAKDKFTSKLSYTHKTNTGTANRPGTTNSKPPRGIIMMGQSETLSSN